MQEYFSILPPPAPPIPVKVWNTKVPSIKCPVCGTAFEIISSGSVECPECGTSYLVGEWNWDSFLVGLGVGLLVGLVISVAVYYFVIRPYVPAIRIAQTIGALSK